MPDNISAGEPSQHPTVEAATRAPPAVPSPEATARRVGLLALSLLARSGCCHCHRLGRGCVPQPDRTGPQRLFPWPVLFCLRLKLFHSVQPLGHRNNPGAGHRWDGGHLDRLQFAPEAKGPGVPEVMDAIYYQQGVIRPVVAVVKSIASAIAIGTGAAVGREGPII
jgi:CIC family chloride channel protein